MRERSEIEQHGGFSAGLPRQGQRLPDERIGETAEGIAESRRRFGPVPIRIGAQSRLEGFYRAFGFVREGEDYIEDGIAHCAMVRT